MASGTFPGSFWRRLLKLVDAELEAEASMVIIGGAAIALEYANRHLTRDLDTSTSVQGALLHAVERARKAIQRVKDGQTAFRLSGYRWGQGRKRQLLEVERGLAARCEEAGQNASSSDR